MYGRPRPLVDAHPAVRREPLLRQEAALVVHLVRAAHPIAEIDVGKPHPLRPDDMIEDHERATRAAIATAQAKLAWQLIKDAAPGVDPTISPAGLASVFSVLSDGADAKMKAGIVNLHAIADTFPGE